MASPSNQMASQSNRLSNDDIDRAETFMVSFEKKTKKNVKKTEKKKQKCILDPQADARLYTMNAKVEKVLSDDEYEGGCKKDESEDD